MGSGAARRGGVGLGVAVADDGMGAALAHGPLRGLQVAVGQTTGAAAAANVCLVTQTVAGGGV